MSLTQTVSRALAEQGRRPSEAVGEGTICRMDAGEEEDMRRLYLLMVEDHPEEVFSQLAVPLKEELLRSEAGQQLLEGQARDVTLAAGGRVRTCSKEIFSIGRKENCDVRLQDRSISRMHLWVFNLPGAIVVVDGWSCSGTFVTEWEAQQGELPRSCPGARCAFLLPHGSPATLRLGASGRLTLNPKLCVVCWERPRALRLPCGHQAVCKPCADKLWECPLCRAQLAESAAEEIAQACVGKTYAPSPLRGSSTD